MTLSTTNSLKWMDRSRFIFLCLDPVDWFVSEYLLWTLLSYCSIMELRTHNRQLNWIELVDNSWAWTALSKLNNLMGTSSNDKIWTILNLLHFNN